MTLQTTNMTACVVYTQGPKPSVNDTEIRKQLSKMARNKKCGPDGLPIEAIMMVEELKPELLTYILQRIMANIYIVSQIAGRKVNAYRYSKTKVTSSNSTITRESN